jgi:threonine synthase
MLPVQDLEPVVTLGEGGTPLVELEELGRRLDVKLFIKDESRNPTGSFKARGVSAAISRLRELGWTSLAVPTTGSGGSAWAAVAARAGLRMTVGVAGDQNVSELAHLEPAGCGAQVQMLSDIGSNHFQAFEAGLAEGTLCVGAFREPYRVEGEKTLFYEVAEQLGGRAPNVMVWPTGGAVGLVGIAKAYRELVELGRVGPSPRLTVVSAQHTSCAPIAVALRDGTMQVEPAVPNGLAPGVWVGLPAYPDYILGRVRASCSTTGVTANGTELLSAIVQAARLDGVSLGPEGGLGLAAFCHFTSPAKWPQDQRWSV